MADGQVKLIGGYEHTLKTPTVLVDLQEERLTESFNTQQYEEHCCRSYVCHCAELQLKINVHLSET